MLPVIALVASFVLVPQDPARDADAAFAALVPADACTIVRFASLDELHRTMGVVLRVAEQPAPPDATAVLVGPLACPGPIASIDRTRPFGLALTIPVGGMQPLRTFVLPVTDADAYITAIAAAPGAWTGSRAGDYVAVSELDGYAPAPAPSQLVAGLARTTISARIDMRRVMDAFAPMVDMGMQEFRRGYESGEASRVGAAMFGDLPGLAEDFADALQQVDLTLALDGSRAELDVVLGLDPQTRLGTPSTVPAGFDTSLLSRLPAGGIARAVTSLDIAALIPRLRSMVDALVAEMPLSTSPELKAQFEQFGPTMSRFEQIAPLFGRTSAVQYDLGANGLSGCVLFSSPDPTRLAAEYAKLMSETVLPTEMSILAITPLPDRRIGEHTLHELRVQFDASKLAAGARSPAELDAMRSALELAYGKNGARCAFGAGARELVIAVNSADADIARALTSAATASNDPLLARMHGADCGVWMQFDVGRMMALGMQAATAGVVRAGDAHAQSGASMRMTLWGGARLSHRFGGVSLDLDELGRFVATMGRGAVTGR